MPVGNETNHTVDGLTVQGGLAVRGRGSTVAFLAADGTGGLSVNGSPAMPSEVLRYRAVMAAQGYYNETLPRNATSNASALITGNGVFVSFGAVAGDTVSAIGMGVNTGVTAATLLRFGIYDRDGVSKASSVDVKAAFTTTGVKTVALSSYTFETTDLYYVGAIFTGTTGPSLLRATGGGSGQAGVNGAAYGHVGVQTGLADLPSPATISFAPGSTLQIWYGLVA